MKKIVYYIPAATGVLLYGFLGILGSFTAISPWAWICVGILFLAGILMARGKLWGALPGVLIGIVLVLMSFQYTGQVIDIERPLGIVLCTYYIACGLYLFRKAKMPQPTHG